MKMKRKIRIVASLMKEKVKAKMSYRFFRKNKLGDTWISKETVVLLVVGFIILLFSVFIGNLYASTISEKDDGSKANLDRIYDDIKILIEKPAKAYHTDNYFIGEGNTLVGFDTQWDDSKKVINLPLWPDSNIYKPFKCGNSACLCLYNKNWEPNSATKRNQGVLSCRSEIFAGKDIVFLSEGGDVEPKTKGVSREDVSGSYLVLEGDGKVHFIYIEKDYRKESKYYIYISSINEDKDDDPANIRKKQIDSLVKT